jgi:O-antigen ligase
VDEAVNQSVAVGFFRHPNAFGGYVFWPFLISLGFLHDRRKRWIALALVLLFGFSLYLSYYRTLLLGLGFALVLYILLWLRPSPRLLAVSVSGLSILAVAASALALQLAPNLSFFNNLWFRINLWHKAFAFIQQSPVILLFGSGFNPSVALSGAGVRMDPHDAFLYMLMHYGIPGLLIFLGIIWLVLRKGWLAYRDGVLHRRPVLAALWVGWIAWFLTDLIDSRLTTPEWQMLFVVVLAIFLGGLAVEKDRAVLDTVPEGVPVQPQSRTKQPSI